METRLLAGSLIGLGTMLLCTGCGSTPQLTEYPQLIDLPLRDLGDIGAVPIILVGTVHRSSNVGRKRLSRWTGQALVQLVRLDVDVETVLPTYARKGAAGLRNGVSQGDNSIYFYWYPVVSYSGPPRLGIEGEGGNWHAGDRLMLFLQRENEYLRTVCDQWKHCTVDVFSGAHTDYQPRSNDVTHSIIDILLTRGRGATDQQMIKAIDAFNMYSMNTEYAIEALEKLANSETPAVSKAARQQLDQELSMNCTQPPGCGGDPWDVPCVTHRKTHPLKPVTDDQNKVLRGVLRAIPPK